MIKSKIPLTVIVITKNEESNIDKCLKACLSASEIFVVDSQSTDRTKEMALEYIPRGNVITFIWNGKWPKKKYWALLNLPISNEWVLLLDADEIPTEEFWQEINKRIGENKTDAYAVKFSYYFMGKLIKHGDPVRKLVLFKKSKAKYLEENDGITPVGFDYEGHSHPVISGKVGVLKSRIIHRDFKGLDSFFRRHNKYSTWEAMLLTKLYYRKYNGTALWFKNPAERRRFMKRLFMRLPLKPLIYFLYAYILRLGFLDGKTGLYYNLCKCFYFLQIELKVEENIKNEILA